MAQRKVFIDEEGNEITSVVNDDKILYIEITQYGGNEHLSIHLNAIDAIDFIDTLYKMRKQIRGNGVLK